MGKAGPVACCRSDTWCRFAGWRVSWSWGTRMRLTQLSSCTEVAASVWPTAVLRCRDWQLWPRLRKVCLCLFPVTNRHKADGLTMTQAYRLMFWRSQWVGSTATCLWEHAFLRPPSAESCRPGTPSPIQLQSQQHGICLGHHRAVTSTVRSPFACPL